MNVDTHGPSETRPVSFVLISLFLMGLACGTHDAGPDSRARRLTPAPAANETAKEGGSLRVPLAADPGSFNPLLTGPERLPEPWRQIYPVLVIAEPRGAAPPLVQGDLARAWTWSPEQRTLTCTLRQGRFWEDTLRVTVGDVVRTYEAYRAAGWLARRTPGDSLPDAGLLTVSAIDDSTVRLSYGPGISFWRALPAAGWPVMPARKLSDLSLPMLQANPLGHEPISAASFRVTDWRHGLNLWLAPNPMALGRRKPFVERVEMDVCPGLDSRILRLQLGRADVVTAVAPHRLDFLLEGDTIPQLHHDGIAAVEMLCWNTYRPAFTVSLRRAVSLAIDRERITRELLTWKGIACGGPAAGLLEPRGPAEGAEGADEAKGRLDDLPAVSAGSPADSMTGRGALRADSTAAPREPRRRDVAGSPQDARRVGSESAGTPLDHRGIESDSTGTGPGPSDFPAIVMQTHAGGDTTRWPDGGAAGGAARVLGRVTLLDSVLGDRGEVTSQSSSGDTERANTIANIGAGTAPGVVPGVVAGAAPGVAPGVAPDTTSAIIPEALREPESQDLLSRFDPVEANRLLDIAGWSERGPDGVRMRGGVPLRIEMLYQRDDEFQERLATLLESDLARVGVELVAEPVTGQMIWSHFRAGLFDTALLGFRPPVVPDVSELWASWGYWNGGQYANVRVDSLCTALRQEESPRALERLARRIESIVRRDGPVTFLVYREWTALLSPRVRGFRGTAGDPLRGLERVWMADSTITP